MVGLNSANEIEVKRLQRIAEVEDDDRQNGGEQDRSDKWHTQKHGREKHSDDKQQDHCTAPVSAPSTWWGGCGASRSGGKRQSCTVLNTWKTSDSAMPTGIEA